MDDSESYEINPVTQDVFGITIDKIRNGQAQTLPTFDTSVSLTQLGRAEPGLPTTFIDRARSFLDEVITTVAESDASEAGRITALNSTLGRIMDVSGGAGGAPRAMSLHMMKLGALIFVGAPQEVSVGAGEITSLLHEVGQNHLNAQEQEIVNALATGIETGYGNLAVDTFSKLARNINSHTGHRMQAPQRTGNDFIKALLVTKL